MVKAFGLVFFFCLAAPAASVPTPTYARAVASLDAGPSVVSQKLHERGKTRE